MSSSTTSTLSSAQSASAILEQEGIVAHFQEMGRSFLGNAEFNNHFFAVPDGKDAKNIKFEISDGVPFKFHLYGVLLPQTAGTKINAGGNYNGGEGAYFRPLRDANVMGRQVKDVHAIAVPSWAIAKMSAQISNSIVTLNTVDNGVRRLDDGKGIPPPVNTFDWVKSSNGDEIDIILVHSQNKYGLTRKLKKPLNSDSAPSTAVRRTSKVNVDNVNINSSSTSHSDTVATSGKKKGISSSWFDPAVQKDYGGPYFDLQTDKLRQQEVYDIDGDLVHPSYMYEVLRPGTLIEYICQLHVFNIANKNSKNPGSNRYYQIQFSSAHVLLESDDSPCPRDRFSVPAEYSTLLANTAPSLPNGPSTDFQTYAEKKRANQRMKTSSNTSSTSSSRPVTQTRTRQQAVSDKAKGKKKEVTRSDANDDEMN